MSKLKDWLKQVDEHLNHGNQAWLLGAGVSFDAGLPLMAGLTRRVLDCASIAAHEALLDDLKAELPPDAHIEHMLSHLGDYTALAKRSRVPTVTINGHPYTAANLEDAHSGITENIATTLRWGFIDGTPPVIGDSGSKSVKVDGHLDFVKTLFDRRRMGVREPARPIRFFTTNYDTLLEDALALSRYNYWDGFSGGAVAFRQHKMGVHLPGEGIKASVIKLHGSIDWFMDEDGHVIRVREADGYPTRDGKRWVLIYPQATKYVATQADPFAAQFESFRNTLGSGKELVFSVCGYSFGDDHINEEIERAMASDGNKTTLLAFCKEGAALPPILETWRQSGWGKRVFILTEKGVYWAKESISASTGIEHNWWTFAGVTKFLLDGGAEAIA
jgi:hypothetical protein